MKIAIINGPNLNLLGKRETNIYGNKSFEDYLKWLKNEFPEMELNYFQSNHEGELIDKIHEWGFSYDFIILNAGALSHSSIALADAILAIQKPVIEVHISNPMARESFRHHSYLTPVCKGVISGFGLESYYLSIKYCENTIK